MFLILLIKAKYLAVVAISIVYVAGLGRLDDAGQTKRDRVLRSTYHQAQIRFLYPLQYMLLLYECSVRGFIPQGRVSGGFLDGCHFFLLGRFLVWEDINEVTLLFLIVIFPI
jgi:hypothetical protein